ncbi:TPA: hypothetical protein N0F65_006514 [Lagenidium giganteum]|uniref:Uncharacterized protein n=1 Tax=Lagenidium giganteum TaxID=4803 RepID=A0AAV2YHR0_9STRA|nr:TPA: hypothetical protein N0F65_012869 [Lagenidium giganteum]DAZ96468.1 TPA: hypothetical protein N0F65_006514 [Lagenidium giganteum]
MSLVRALRCVALLVLVGVIASLAAVHADAGSQCGSVPFVSVPSAYGINTCVGNNKAGLLKIAAASPLKCSIFTLMKIPRSKPLLDLHDMIKQMIDCPWYMSARFHRYMTGMGDKEMNAFCADLSNLVLPCADALLPSLIDMIHEDTQCCSQLSDLLDMLYLVVPAGIDHKAFLLNDILNSVNSFFCSRRDDTKQTCGRSMFSQLIAMHTEEDFVIFGSMLLPFLTIAPGQECRAMTGLPYNNSASSTMQMARTIDYSCCVHQIRPLFTAVTQMFESALALTPAEFLNGVVDFPSTSSAKFVDSVAATAQCQFQTKCSNPAFIIKPQPREVRSAPGVARKNILPDDVKCTRVERCDTAGTVCSEVCQYGTADLTSDWMKQTLKFQRALAESGPLCLAQVPATHNSAITLADGYGNRDQLINRQLNPRKATSIMQTNNHLLSVVDQLNLGVRFVEIDTHLFLGDFRTGHCGTIGSKTVDTLFYTVMAQLVDYGEVHWSPPLLGCFPSLSGIRADEQMKTKTAMHQIRQWLDKPANKDEFVFVYLDTGAEIGFQNFEGLNSIIREAFVDLIVPADILDSLDDREWRNASIDSLKKDGYRVVVLANRHTGVAYNLDRFCGGHVLLDTKLIDSSPDAFGRIGETAIYGSDYFVRSYQSRLRYISINQNGGLSRELPDFLTPTNIAKYVRWNVNLVAADMLDGASMRGFVWSWAENEPSTSANATTFINADGRWRTSATLPREHKACWHGSDLDWIVIPYTTECPRNSTASFPRDAYQNTLLLRAIQKAEISHPVVIDAPTIKS